MVKPQKDWHPEDIKAAVRKTGVSLSELSLAFGLPQYACRAALQGPFFDGEMAIAERLGLSPRQIWPSRFRPDGSRKHHIRRQNRTKSGTVAPVQSGAEASA